MLKTIHQSAGQLFRPATIHQLPAIQSISVPRPSSLVPRVVADLVVLVQQSEPVVRYGRDSRLMGRKAVRSVYYGPATRYFHHLLTDSSPLGQRLFCINTKGGRKRKIKSKRTGLGRAGPAGGCAAAAWSIPVICALHHVAVESTWADRLDAKSGTAFLYYPAVRGFRSSENRPTPTLPVAGCRPAVKAPFRFAPPAQSKVQNGSVRSKGRAHQELFSRLVALK